MIGDVEKMVTVGLIWGATNALMRKGALISTTTKPSSNKNPLLRTLTDWFNILLIWQYSLPFIINLSASATFFMILNDTPISVAVPVTNATTFAATAVFGMLLGEETRLGLCFLGTLLIVVGVCVCVV
ncbi:transmembrane protein 234 [Tanacetum coccineum]